MSTGLIILVVLGGLLVVLAIVAIWLIGTYNRLVSGRNQVKAGWAQIDVLLKRRYDLIPNLVNTVKGYASHEKETLERVIAARNAAAGAMSRGPEAVAQAEGQLTGALRQLFAVAEAYPNLKADQSFLQLQGELTNTENGISGQRQGYNDLVRVFNTSVQVFPTNLIAGMFGFKAEAFFEVTDSLQREAPKVQF